VLDGLAKSPNLDIHAIQVRLAAIVGFGSLYVDTSFLEVEEK
jgi:hypothetical protein